MALLARLFSWGLAVLSEPLAVPPSQPPPPPVPRRRRYAPVHIPQPSRRDTSTQTRALSPQRLNDVGTSFSSHPIQRRRAPAAPPQPPVAPSFDIGVPVERSPGVRHPDIQQQPAPAVRIGQPRAAPAMPRVDPIRPVPQPIIHRIDAEPAQESHCSVADAAPSRRPRFVFRNPV
jgi:hypothetical protein